MIEYEAKVLDVDEMDICNRLDDIGASRILDAITYIEGYDFSQGNSLPSRDLGGSVYCKRFKGVIDKICILDGLGTMFEQGAYLRLREEGDGSELIFKQNIGDSLEVKSEIEISEPIERSEWDGVAKWLEDIGLERIAVQEKKRVSYKYESFRYDIDTWPGVPTYLEVEAPSPEGVIGALALIGINKDRALSMPAAQVFEMYRVSNPRYLRFNDNDN